MTGLVYEFDFSKTGPLADGTASKKLRENVSNAIRRSLVLVDRHHKFKEMRQHGGKSKPVRGKVTKRTGVLSKSYTSIWRKGSLEGSYGSNMTRARMLELGGVIRPKTAKALAIPTDRAKHGVGGSVSPRLFPDLFVLGSKHGRSNALVRRNSDGGLEVMFWLVKQVTIPARPGLANTVRATGEQITNNIADAILGAV